ncbi:hypothetical protein [Fibrella forsythiae]|uniref:Uncharacterized protein n=1 Tax=Fibrella forsythiae TaxID=2817061 RepID=A0ABS3JJH7_9BACT|nr:hypothetical protein [Fibrella forsythiae]MBO0949052.1 hypothetical protein [Fibrella forsythiae]
MKTRVIFASLILGLSLTATSNAAIGVATTTIDDSPAANKPAGTMLINGSEKMFSLYADQKMNHLTRQPEWQTCMNVVTKYNENPVSVLNLSAAERDSFKQASSVVTKQLAKQKDGAASLWLNQVNNTVRMISYFWVVSQEVPQLPDNE